MEGKEIPRQKAFVLLATEYFPEANTSIIALYKLKSEKSQTQLNEHGKLRGKNNVPLLLDFPFGDQLLI